MLDAVLVWIPGASGNRWTFGYLWPLYFFVQLILDRRHCPQTLCGRVMHDLASDWSRMNHGHVRFEQEHRQADATKVRNHFALHGARCDSVVYGYFATQ